MPHSCTDKATYFLQKINVISPRHISPIAEVFLAENILYSFIIFMYDTNPLLLLYYWENKFKRMILSILLNFKSFYNILMLIIDIEVW